MYLSAFSNSKYMYLNCTQVHFKFDVLTSTFKSFLSTFSLSKFLLIFQKFVYYIIITTELSFFHMFIDKHSFRLNFHKSFTDISDSI